MAKSNNRKRVSDILRRFCKESKADFNQCMAVYDGLTIEDRIKHLFGVKRWLEQRAEYKRQQNIIDKKVKRGLLIVGDEKEKEKEERSY